MNPGTKTQHSDSYEVNRKISNDLKAQLINIRGFCDELEKTAATIKCLTDDQRLNDDPDYLKKLDDLLANDLFPCIKFLSLSANQLDKVILQVGDLNSGNGAD